MWLRIEKGLCYGTRLAVFPILLVCYSKRMLEGSLFKLGLIMAGNLGLIFTADYAGNYFMWVNTEPII